MALSCSARANLRYRIARGAAHGISNPKATEQRFGSGPPAPAPLPRLTARRRFTQGALFRRVQIALKPTSKTLGLHGVFMRSKGLKDLIADSAFKRMQIDVQGACRLDADEHHLGLAPRTGRAPNCSEWNDGR